MLIVAPSPSVFEFVLYDRLGIIWFGTLVLIIALGLFSILWGG